MENTFFKEATSHLERAAERQPSPEIYLNLASAYKQQLKLKESIACLNKAIDLVGDKNSYGKKARQELNELIKIIETNSGLSIDQYFAHQDQFDFAFKLLSQNQFENAIECFNKVIELEPRHVQSYGNLGLCYAGLGDKESAIKNLDKAIELDPEYKPAIDNREVVMQLNTGEKLNSNIMKEVQFYAEKAKSNKSEPLLPIHQKPSIGKRILELFRD